MRFWYEVEVSRNINKQDISTAVGELKDNWQTLVSEVKDSTQTAKDSAKRTVKKPISKAKGKNG